MNKRDFIKLPLAVLATNVFHTADASPFEKNNIDQDGVSFAWRHETHALIGIVKAPTRGWVAVGFNESSELKNTRFIIAAVSTSPIHVEEHLALVPEHRPVEELGMPATLIHAEGGFTAGVSTLIFTLPHKIPGRPNLNLAPGNTVNVMLAWSMEQDFDHHSAWRRHFTITL